MTSTLLAQSKSTAKAQATRPKKDASSSESIVAAAAPTDSQAKGKQAIKSLNELPRYCWATVPNAVPGYQYHTRVAIGETQFPVVPDGGSSVSSITEGLLIRIINEQRMMGVRLDDKGIQYERSRNGPRESVLVV